ncbi:hypothetical protein IJO12_05340, partial [bacterium]|nr:hypothetical protein [bacterium]
MEDFNVKVDVDDAGEMKLALVTPDGKIYPVDGAEEIIAGVMAKVLDSDIKPEEIKVDENIKTQETTDDVKFIAKDATTSKILKIPVKEYNVSVKLQNNSPLDINIIEKMDGSREVNLYWENKLVKDGTTPPTDKNLPGIPLGEDLIKIPFENGEDIYINVTHKLNGVKDFQILDKNPNLSSENNETKETNKSSENNAIITEKPKENPTIQSAKIFSNTAKPSKYAVSDPLAKIDLLEKQIIENYKYKLEYIEKNGNIYYVKSDKNGIISEEKTTLKNLPNERKETYIAANNSKIIITRNNHNKIIKKNITDNESNLDFYIDYIPYDSKEKITGIQVHKNSGDTDEIAYNASYRESYGNIYLERETYMYFDNDRIMNKETRIYDESGQNVLGQIIKINNKGESEAEYYEISPYTNGNKIFIDYDPNDKDFMIRERSSVFNEHKPQFEQNVASKNYKKKYNTCARLFNGNGFDDLRAEITVNQDGNKSVNLYINDKLVDNGTYMPDKNEEIMLNYYEDSLIIRYNNDEDELFIKVKYEADGTKKFEIYDDNNDVIYPIKKKIEADITKDNTNKILDDLLNDYPYNIYKDEILKNFDYENAHMHLENLKELIKNKTKRIREIIGNGYFSSKEGAEALEYILNNFNSRGYDGIISEVDRILQNITPEEVFRGIKRGLSNINDLKTYSQLTDEEYERRENSPYKNDLDYVSSNDNINKILCKLGRENIKISRIIDEIILKSIAENPAKENEILDCYSTIFTSSNINIWAISEDNVINSYKKAYEYIKENNIENAKIIILDSNSSDLYSKIWDPWYGDKFNDNWNFIFFDKNGNFIRSDLGHSSDAQITEKIKNTSGYINYDADITNGGDRIYLNNSKKEVFDNDGNLLYIETYVESNT